MTIKVRVTFSERPRAGRLGMFTSTIEGEEVDYSCLTIGDMTRRIEETEAHLSRITGMEVKIQTGSE